MYRLSRTGRTRSTNIWPGFVDALATLLLVVIFVLMVFVVAQFYLSSALSGKDQRLAELDQQIAELSELLSLERSANAELRINVTELSSELQSSLATRDSLRSQLSDLQDSQRTLKSELSEAEGARDSLANQLAAMVEARDRLTEALNQAGNRGDALQAELEQAYKTLDANKEKIETQLAELAILKDLRDRMEAEVARLEKALAASESERTALAASKEDLDRQLAERGEELAVLRGRLDKSQDFAIEQQQLSEEAQRKVDLLNRQLAALRRQLQELSAALEVAENRNREQEVQIVDLGKRLNAALATKVQELARYRSEFFGRLRQVLGDNPNIRIVGDRFVFQAEVLFPSASDELQPEGRAQIASLAGLLRELSAKIPEDIDWVLRIDGHTDARPISTARFPSNWELSSARAIAVVKFLIDQGIPPNRLVAAGFGQYQPLEPGTSEPTYRRNRRIEFKLTER